MAPSARYSSTHHRPKYSAQQHSPPVDRRRWL